MKATAQSLTASTGIEKSRVAVFCELIKVRLTTLVLLTALVGFYAGTQGGMDFTLLFHAMLGTALVASGASALNQWLERELDAKMDRTADRPLPSGRLQPSTVMAFGVVCGVVGLVYLSLAVNVLTGLLGAITFASYV